MDTAERARSLVDRYWEQLLELEPLTGTVCGDERYDDRLPDPSERGRSASETVNSAALSELRTIDRTELDVSLRGSLDILEAIAHRSLTAIHLRTDRLSVASHLWGPGQLLAEMGSLQRADTPERIERYEARLRAIPAYLESCAEIARESVAARVTSPRVVAERAVAQVERLLALAPEDSPALMPVRDGAPARERVATLVRDVVDPAYARYHDVLRDYLPHATETIGVSALPGGDEIYGAEIHAWTTLPLDAREVHDIGNERFAAIGQERLELASQLGYASANEAIAARRASGENQFSSRAAMVELAEEQVTRSWEAAPAYFGRLPGSNCDVRPVEEFREADMPFAFYHPPTEDGTRRGIYYVNAYDLPSRDMHQLASVTYHEANPGHHFQLTLEQEMPDVPMLRRFGGFYAGSAFCEGWGLYSERLADEMGLYLDDWERLGMLDAQAHRAARLITDTGIHALGWSREDAIAKVEEGGQSHTDAVIEVDRYIAMPGQALSYMIGMIEIERARAAAAAREGAAFSLSGFHDRLLALGQLPLPALRREIG
ncbi:MAG: DUF885 domain-containing protein [Actinomycetota bacterium]|nr:DUF885 domain-containing protein [Actinomycetota bacterium]